jgi:TorA maturation chaperone TorD
VFAVETGIVEGFSAMELEGLLSNRCSMYGFLARVYRVEVDQDLLDRMTDMNLSVEVDAPEISQGYAILRRFLQNQRESALTDLAVDYARTFLGAGLVGGDGAYPYESVYTNADRLVMQDARDEVLKLYREEGLDRAREFNEPEDHLALELEFMAYLCQRSAAALKAGDNGGALGYLQKQHEFLAKHLLAWVPAFSQDVQRLAREEFYRAVAKITVGYLNMERELIGELIDEIRDGRE